MPRLRGDCYDTGLYGLFKFIDHGIFLNDTDLPSRPGPTIIPRAEHGISRSNVSENALKVLYRLRSIGCT